MSSGPENRLIKAIHGRLPKEMHAEKMHNPYRGGTADCWYSGSASDLWVEYKYINKVPVKARVKPNLSELQKIWLKGRYGEGRRVFVAVGCPEGVALLQNPKDWEEGVPAKTFKGLIMTRNDFADWIVRSAMGDTDAKSSRAARSSR
jgi:hypothetical protein